MKEMIAKTRTIVLMLLLFGGTAAGAGAQVMVAPPIVVMRDSDRFGTFMVTNRGNDPQEVTIDFRFGYPTTNEAGDIYLEYEDSAAASRYSIAPWLRAFPRRFVLGPGERQTVRFTIAPPAGLNAGGYWTRLVTGSVSTSPPADTVVAEGVRTQIVFRLEQVTTVLYLVGQPTMRLTGGPIEVAVDSGAVDIRSRVSPGETPYIGVATLRVLDGTGSVVHEQSRGTAIYLPMEERFVLEPGVLPPGTYAVELSFVPGRSDLDPAQTPAGEPLDLRTTFTLE